MREKGEAKFLRRYEFKLYPTKDQQANLHHQRKMIADLWNALLQRFEDISRRTVQRQNWIDKNGKKMKGKSVHCLKYSSLRKKERIEEIIYASEGSETAKPFTAYDMQNEITAMLNDPDFSEWRNMSVWCAHRTAALLDKAIKAFFSRAAGGAGKSSGYPRFKRRDKHNSIPHRFASGCKLIKSDRHTNSWIVRLKGIEDDIHARGKFPLSPEKFTDADVIWRDNNWWISIAVEIDGRRNYSGRVQTIVKFDLIDCFAIVNNYPTLLLNIEFAENYEEQATELQRALDIDFPRGKRYIDDEKAEIAERRRKIAHLKARAVRVRKNAIHVWSDNIVRQANDITIIAPPSIRESTKSPHGNEQLWGASTEIVSEINRNVLRQSPAAAIAMLKYKAHEAGIRCDVIEDEAPNIAVGSDLVIAGMKARKVRRQINQESV